MLVGVYIKAQTEGDSVLMGQLSRDDDIRLLSSFALKGLLKYRYVHVHILLLPP